MSIQLRELAQSVIGLLDTRPMLTEAEEALLIYAEECMKGKETKEGCLKAFIHVPGEPSVGINGCVYVVETPLEHDNPDYDYRRNCRNALQKCYAEMEDNNMVYVQFEDECPDCSKIGCNGECMLQEETQL